MKKRCRREGGKLLIDHYYEERVEGFWARIVQQQMGHSAKMNAPALAIEGVHCLLKLQSSSCAAIRMLGIAMQANEFISLLETTISGCDLRCHL